eukprot:1336549-Rhodomonas_salina.2
MSTDSESRRRYIIRSYDEASVLTWLLRLSAMAHVTVNLKSPPCSSSSWLALSLSGQRESAQRAPR